MASTTIIGTDLALKQRQISVQQNREPSPPLTPEHEKDAPLSRPTPLEGQARANTAAAQGKDDPYGFKSRKKTTLEQHCMFFDKDNDGVIWPTDTWRTCREFGWGIRLSLFFTVFLHLVQSWGTVPWFWLIPDPLFRVWIHNISNNKHGSSTLSIDNWGEYRPALLDEFFDRYDTEDKGGVTFWEGFYGLRDMRNPWDIFGQISVLFEWGMTYALLWPEDGVLLKEDMVRVLDGSIFHEMTTTRKSNRNAKVKA